MLRDVSDNRFVSLAYLPATSQQLRPVLVLAALLTAGLGGVAAFAATPLPQSPAAVVSIDTAIFVNDLITSALLFAQYSIVSSRALLVLASGYCSSALFAIPHALTFPHAFAPTGLLGADLQSTAWIYFFWHIASPATIIAYALLKGAGSANDARRRGPAASICWCVVATVFLVCLFTWIAIADDRFLPVVFFDPEHFFKSTSTMITAVILVIAATALAILWAGRPSVLDYWLMLVLWALISEQILGALLVSDRFSLGYYTGRAFSLVTSLLVLILLLEEMTKLYGRLARSNSALECERSSKFMNIEAATAAIAHEIRQPLAAMVANAGASLAFLEKAPPNFLEAKEALRDILTEGHRASDSLDGIRTLFRSVNQRQELIDVNEIALEVLNALRGELNDLGVIAQPELMSEIPRIHGSRSQLQLVMFNLVHNAVDAMRDTTNRSRLLRLITQDHDRDSIVVAVQDSGPGIDPNRLDGIFEAFVTTKSHGMGLGLAISRVIIERHGGKLTAFSDGKNGAIFQFVLPIKSTGETAPRA